MLANIIGISKQTIANWKNDRSKPQINDTIIDSSNIIYPFLLNELINIKLLKEEIEILFAMEYFENYSNGKFIDNKLQYNDYINIFNSGQYILPSRHNIERILDYINIDVLINIIIKNNLTTFNIQQLLEEDIYTILKTI